MSSSLSLESYKQPNDPQTGERSPESVIFQKLIQFAHRRIMAILLSEKKEFSQKELLQQIGDSIDNITAIRVSIRHILHEEIRQYEKLSQADYFQEDLYTTHCPLLAILFPDRDNIWKINIRDIEIPEDLIVEFKKNIGAHFQRDDSLEQLERISPHITPAIKKMSREAIIVSKHIDTDYNILVKWIEKQMNTPGLTIPWENIDNIFFTSTFSPIVQQILEAIFISKALMKVLNNYKVIYHDENSRHFIALLQAYLKKQAFISATKGIDIDEGQFRNLYRDSCDKQEDKLRQISIAIQGLKYQAILDRFITDIKSVDNQTNFMAQPSRLGIQGTKEHWVGVYGLGDLLALGNNNKSSE